MNSNADSVFDVDEASFDERVLAASAAKPVMVDFWAEWCAPCLHLAPIMDRVMVTHSDRVSLAKLEVDDNMRLAGRYKVKGFPTVILFVDGQEVDRFAGAKPQRAVEAFLDQHLR